MQLGAPLFQGLEGTAVLDEGLSSGSQTVATKHGIWHAHPTELASPRIQPIGSVEYLRWPLFGVGPCQSAMSQKALWAAFAGRKRVEAYQPLMLTRVLHEPREVHVHG